MNDHVEAAIAHTRWRAMKSDAQRARAPPAPIDMLNRDRRPWPGNLTAGRMPEQPAFWTDRNAGPFLSPETPITATPNWTRGSRLRPDDPRLVRPLVV